MNSDGQMTLFDYLGKPEYLTENDRLKNYVNQVLDKVHDRIISYDANYPNLEYSERISLAKRLNVNSGGGCSDYIYNITRDGIDIDFKNSKSKWIAHHVGWPMFDERYNGVSRVVEIPDCKYSGHACNKEELWKVADTLDGFVTEDRHKNKCQKVCCRLCDVRLCGVRCNGSKEPEVKNENNRRKIY